MEEKESAARRKYIQLTRHGYRFHVTPHWNHSDEKIIAAIEAEGYFWNGSSWEVSREFVMNKFKKWMETNDYTN